MYFSKRTLCASTHFCVSIQKSVKDNMQLRAIIIIVIERCSQGEFKYFEETVINKHNIRT